MKEKDLNRVVFKNFRNQGNFGHKISDDAQSFGRIASVMFNIPANYFNGIHGEMPNKSLKKNINFFKNQITIQWIDFIHKIRTKFYRKE